jgi:thiol-disulfide isomerase/thioredoxin
MYNARMKKLLIALLLVIALSSVFAASPKNSFSELKAVDLKSDVITSEIFKEYDVTMINVFTTWCYYCIIEMPELQQMTEELPENVNLIFICADAYEAPKDLKEIVDYFKLTSTILKMKGKEVLSYYNISGYLTSFFVDGQGNILQTAVGANSKDGYMKIINSLLEKSK